MPGALNRLLAYRRVVITAASMRIGGQACVVKRQTSDGQILLDVNGMTDELNLLVKLASVQRVTNLILMVIAYRP